MRSTNSLDLIVRIEDLLVELKKELGVSRPNESGKDAAKPKKKLKKKYTGLTVAILNLIEKGFFEQPKKLSDIQAKLRNRGMNKPTTTIMAPLLTLIRDEKLERDKPQKGQFVYFERKD